MKILMIILFRHMGDEKHPVKLAAVQDLASFKYACLRRDQTLIRVLFSLCSFFTRGSIAEHLKFGTRTIVQRTPSGARQTVELKKELAFVVHVRSLYSLRALSWSSPLTVACPRLHAVVPPL
jgi:hypothetical protein